MKKTPSRFILLGLIAASTVSIVMAVFLMSPDQHETLETKSTASAGITGQPPVTIDAVSMQNFFIGDRTTVTLILLTKPGFAVIHDDRRGRPDTILGYSRLLSPGKHTHVDVSLSRSTVEGEPLYVLLHADDGDGVFSESDDQPVTSPQGYAVMMQYVAGEMHVMN